MGKGPKQQFAGVLVLIVGRNEKGTMVRVLLDTGCSKSTLLKHFTKYEQQTKLSNEEKITHKTYNGKFTSGSATSMGFRLIKFENNCDVTVEYLFQVNKMKDPKKVKHNMVI